MTSPRPQMPNMKILTLDAHAVVVWETVSLAEIIKKQKTCTLFVALQNSNLLFHDQDLALQYLLWQIPDNSSIYKTSNRVYGQCLNMQLNKLTTEMFTMPDAKEFEVLYKSIWHESSRWLWKNVVPRTGTEHSRKVWLDMLQYLKYV